ncbi:uncharacterized protein SAPINGB_P006176 [Magnusiomyces paraingens]|uniref:D-2-hydroxyglutarate dehydrogenase, mitochondrial n=1 Tax=Magnusiomyces paraingens TaxID=2606893 RepID=A0A5E8C8T0_9ASCO|nr:uncharacterized protein SAPINGB_P006176 [Saprochaete ingens]VVT58378.1 unnamed protein product [Saprochaete ingens]
MIRSARAFASVAPRATAIAAIARPAILRSIAVPLISIATSTSGSARSFSATPTPHSSKTVKLTSETYPEIKRADFSKISAEDIAFFKSVLPETAVLEASKDDLENYNQDWMRKYKGQAQIVLKPSNAEQISKILQHCNQRHLAVVPQGGNTGLVGGSVPVFDEIVISLTNMNKVRSFDPVTGILVADAGLILENADQYVAEHGFIFPLDLGAKGSCHIGGNVATNAGGLRLLRYGSLHGSVLGIEAVLADGTIVHNLSKLRKDNTGYDLKQLFIGSEGTLGVITGVSILCPPRPTAVNIAFLGLESFEKVQETFVKAKRELSEILSAFECMDNTTQDLVEMHTDLVRPLSEKYPFYVLIETSGSSKEHDDEKLAAFLESAMSGENADGSTSEPVILDGVLAQDSTDVHNLWQWRELIPEALSKNGGVYKYDVSIPLNRLYDLVIDVQKRLADGGVVDGDAHNSSPDALPVIAAAGYGHIGDGNLHLNVSVRRYDKAVEKLLEPYVYEWIEKVQGSISAEHGLGLQKKNYIGYSKNEGMLALMRRTKNEYDPNGILNPYKYL